MTEKPNGPPPASVSGKRAAGSFGAFLIVFVFVWIVFDNLALAFLFALMAGGGTEVAQRAAGSKTDNSRTD